jgi:hypothetical protein
VIGIGLLKGIVLPDKEFPEMQERIVNEIHGNPSNSKSKTA